MFDFAQSAGLPFSVKKHSRRLYRALGFPFGEGKTPSDVILSEGHGPESKDLSVSVLSVLAKIPRLPLYKL